MHWTAGSGRVSPTDKEHYHAIVDQSGRVILGELPVEANLSTRDADGYAAHTLRLNTGSIGLAMAGMAGAEENPFTPGLHPITAHQLRVFVRTVADYAHEYDIRVTRETILTHAEVEPTLGVKQRGKWDITWLPGMDAPDYPIYVGDRLREMIKSEGALEPDWQPKFALKKSKPEKTNWSLWNNFSWRGLKW